MLIQKSQQKQGAKKYILDGGVYSVTKAERTVHDRTRYDGAMQEDAMHFQLMHE